MNQKFYFEILTWRNENSNSKRYIHPYVHYSIIFNSQDMGTMYVSINA